jgi:hypothetical protein
MLGAVVHYLREYRRHKLPAFILQDKASTDKGRTQEKLKGPKPSTQNLGNEHTEMAHGLAGNLGGSSTVPALLCDSMYFTLCI